MRVSHKQHLIHAAIFWMGTGLALGFFGFKWVWLGFSSTWALVFLAICMAVGLVKGEFVIGKSGKRAISRIETLPEKSPFYQVFTMGQWLLVLGMMSLGMLIRFSGVDKSYRGLVLAAVGIALLWASRFFWKAAWKQS